MADAANKTVATYADVTDYIAALEPDRRRDEALQLLALYQRVTGAPPRMWGAGIIGFGEYIYAYPSGRTGTSARSSFSPRKGKHSLYLMAGYDDEAVAAQRDALLAKLGKHKMDKTCLHVTRLDQIDIGVLEALIAHDLAEMNRIYPPK
ncbi:DUF1801 domain-containing protein [Blastomonas sp.]|uniref:DUF1801 domain-containing protein n=1 Tax=Blastomonas sp. TaxID=1909299 RepID=UPI0026364E84|nr:DUF1801 domain-containing protein [Blastomonas sp.]MDM7956383.1 DUF1801 domain-containing protein [Blastomonas sp.]